MSAARGGGGEVAVGSDNEEEEASYNYGYGENGYEMEGYMYAANNDRTRQCCIRYQEEAKF